MLNVVIFGAPGSGKGTQSELIIKKYGLFHISTGDVLRNEIKNGTELGQTAETFIKDGKLVPDQLIIDMLANVLDSNESAKDGVIFDGFPRTIAQAEALNEMLKTRGTAVSVVVGLDVQDQELIDRLLKRGQTSGRSDDNLETITKRLETYHSQTTPLKEFYINEGKYADINGMGTVEEIFARIETAIDSL